MYVVHVLTCQVSTHTSGLVVVSGTLKREQYTKTSEQLLNIFFIRVHLCSSVVTFYGFFFDHRWIQMYSDAKVNKLSAGLR